MRIRTEREAYSPRRHNVNPRLTLSRVAEAATNSPELGQLIGGRRDRPCASCGRQDPMRAKRAETLVCNVMSVAVMSDTMLHAAGARTWTVALR
jgi:hypothetical protein